MKRVRVLVVFEELDTSGQVIANPNPEATKFGATLNIDPQYYGARTEIAAVRMSGFVEGVISDRLPEFLKEVTT